MISDKPRWCALMMNGNKNVEVRTSNALANAIQKLIDENGYADIYVYCTKECGLIYSDTHVNGEYVDFRYYATSKVEEEFHEYQGSGKVVFKFHCYKVEEVYRCGSYLEELGEEIDAFETNKLDNIKLLNCTCLEEKEMNDYFEDKYEACVGYAIHIRNLEIFDEPKELGEFKVRRNDCPFPCFICNVRYCQLKKAPQNFCYVEVE